MATGKTELATGIPEIIAAEALGDLRANLIIGRLVNADYRDELAKYGDTVRVQKRGALSVNAKAEDTDVTIQSPSLSQVNVELNKHYEVSLILEDVGLAEVRPDVLGGWVSDAAYKLAEQVENDLFALYASLTNEVDATAANDAAKIREAAKILNENKNPRNNRFFIVHPDDEAVFLGLDEFINRDYTDAMSGVTGYLGRYAGFEFYGSPLVVQDAGENKNLAFHRDAFTLVTRRMPVNAGYGVYQVAMQEEGIPLRLTISYNADILGVQVTLDTLYGVSVLRDEAGVVYRTTAA